MPAQAGKLLFHSKLWVSRDNFQRYRRLLAIEGPQPTARRPQPAARSPRHLPVANSLICRHVGDKSDRCPGASCQRPVGDWITSRDGSLAPAAWPPASRMAARESRRPGPPRGRTTRAGHPRGDANQVATPTDRPRWPGILHTAAIWSAPIIARIDHRSGLEHGCHVDGLRRCPSSGPAGEKGSDHANEVGPPPGDRARRPGTPDRPARRAPAAKLSPLRRQICSRPGRRLPAAGPW